MLKSANDSSWFLLQILWGVWVEFKMQLSRTSSLQPPWIQHISHHAGANELASTSASGIDVPQRALSNPLIAEQMPQTLPAPLNPASMHQYGIILHLTNTLRPSVGFAGFHGLAGLSVDRPVRGYDQSCSLRDQRAEVQTKGFQRCPSQSSLPLFSSWTEIMLSLRCAASGGGGMTDRPLARTVVPCSSTRPINSSPQQRLGPTTCPARRTCRSPDRRIPGLAFQPPLPLSSGCMEMMLHVFAVPLPCTDRYDQSTP